MDVIYLIGTIQAVFLTILILNKKSKMLADKVLATESILIAFHLLLFYLIRTEVLFDYPELMVIFLGLPMIHGPLTYIYILVITKKVQKIKNQYFLHLVPYILLTGILLIIVSIYHIPGNNMNLELEKNHLAIFIPFLLFNLFLGPTYMVLSVLQLKKHNLNIRKFFSYTEDIDINWLRIILIVNIGIWLIIFLINVLSSTGLISVEHGEDIVFISLSISIFFIGYYGIKQQVVYSVLPNERVIKVKEETQKTNIRYKKSGLTKDVSKEHLENLLQYMEREKPYLNGKLSLKNVALELGLSTNHLSQVINENLDKNFFDFVNEYRVELVKAKMSDPSNKKFTILHIALDCGFNSKSSFNTIFKKQTGLTPSQFLAQV